jgi:hypothetical protein
MKTIKKKRQIKKRAGQTKFTVRDLNRQPAVVLRACDQRGVVQIHARDGRIYSLKAERPPGEQPNDSEETFSERMEKHYRRLKEAGYVPPPPEFQERMLEIIREER